MADWNRVQGATTTTPVGGALSFASPVGNGGIVVGAVLLDHAVTITSITDDQGNGYTVVVSHDDGTLDIYGFRSTGLIANAPVTVTVHTSGASGNFWIVMDEFSPPTGVTSISGDGSSVTFGSLGTTFTSFDTSLPDDLVWACALSSGTSTHGAGFTAGQGDGTNRTTEWGIQASPATVTMNLATQTSTLWGPAFAVNGIVAAAASPTLYGGGMASSEW